MAEFIFTKEKIVAPREKIGMVLQKHTIDEVPPADIDLMIDWAYNEFLPPYGVHSIKIK